MLEDPYEFEQQSRRRLGVTVPLLVWLFMIALIVAGMMQCAQAAEDPRFVAFVFAWKIIDGDTIEVSARIWPNHGALDERVRLVRVDAPETRGSMPQCEKELGQKAKTWTLAKLTNAKQIVVQASIEKPARDSFGRILGDVLIDGVSLSDDGIRAGVFRLYSARGIPWCP